MNRQVFKLIFGGMLLGAAVFFVPFFLLKVIGFFFIAMMFMWLFKGRGHYGRRMAFVDNVRNMSDEEYSHWKSQKGRCGHYSERNKSNDNS